MAKAKKKFKLSRTINGITFVSSRAYQPHLRAARGTYTPIELSEGMKKSSAEQTQANLMAKIVFDAVNNFAPNFKDGKFWSRLVSAFRCHVKGKNSNGYMFLEGMQVRIDYPSSKQGSFTLRDEPGMLMFNYSLKVDTDYCLSVLRIATDELMSIPYPEDRVTIEISKDEPEGNVQLNFAPLASGAQILYVIKCEQVVNGKIEGLLSQKSVSFLRIS
ncbi:MAG: hypothetical protein EOP48_00250 [Sphingobacteriales bacterium]|nr:MAG: hypothetical protein EOP48_00250 [Sphingobacteriales bacterium]